MDKDQQWQALATVWTKLLSKVVWSSFEKNSSNLSYISFFGVNFKNLTIEFHVPYVLKMHIKFRSNRMLFTIQSINFFFIHNFRFQKLEILTFIWWNNNWSLIFLKFCSIKNIIKLYNRTVRFSKFTLSIEIYEMFVEFFSKLVWRETLFPHPQA